MTLLRTMTFVYCSSETQVFRTEALGTFVIRYRGPMAFGTPDTDLARNTFGLQMSFRRAMYVFSRLFCIHFGNRFLLRVSNS